MKNINRIVVFLFLSPIFFSISSAQAQFVIDNNGCVMSDFGINGSIYAGQSIAGSTALPGPVDWFKKTTGRNVIKQDVGTVSTINSLLKGSDPNPIYEVRMDGWLYSQADVVGDEYKMLIDGIWARDNFGGTGGLDKTAYVVSSKNAQDPTVWSPGVGNVLGKNDLIDVAGHMYRSYDGAINELYFVGLINRAEPGGSAYMDFEFFIEDVGYDANTFQFNSGGPDLGHTSFQFESDGVMTRLGDMIYNVTLEGGGTIPGIEVRIWVSRVNYDSFFFNPPANLPFKFGPYFDGAGTNSAYGYASILPLAGAEACGYANIENELPEAPPWGTKNTKSHVFGTSYLPFSIAEVGMSLTDFGLDNYLVQGGGPCSFAWRTFMVKTRSSASFTSALKDFAGPYNWGYPLVEIPTENPKITCANPVVTLTSNPIRNDVTYQWTTSDGNILGASNGSSIQVDQGGSYFVEITLPSSCKVTSDPFVVGVDTSNPQFSNAVISSATNICNLVSPDGSLTAVVVGGSFPLTYKLIKVVGQTETEVATATSINKSDYKFSSLPAGTYRVDVLDANSCSISTPEGTITEKTPVTFTPIVTNVLCYGNNNGKIELGTVTGDAPLSYLWSTGNRSKDLLNVGPGTYSVTITDVNSCVSVFNNLTVNGPSAALSGAITKVDDPGNGGNGSASVLATGGTGPYTYSWIKTGNATVLGTTASLNSIGFGSYSVKITDANSCTKDFTVFLYEAERCFDGIDNNNNGLTDCEDVSCKPSKPTASGPQNPCVEVPSEYTAVQTSTIAGVTFEWSYPSNVRSITGQGTATLSLEWTTSVPGQICVRSINKDPGSSAQCVSAWVCISVSPEDRPLTPAVIKINN